MNDPAPSRPREASWRDSWLGHHLLNLADTVKIWWIDVELKWLDVRLWWMDVKIGRSDGRLKWLTALAGIPSRVKFEFDWALRHVRARRAPSRAGRALRHETERDDYAAEIVNERERLAVAAESGDPVGAARSVRRLGALLRLKGDFAESEEATVDARSRFDDLGMRDDVADCDLDLAELLTGVGRFAAASERVGFALDHSRGAGDDVGTGRALRARAAIHRATGRYDDAQAAIAEARDVFVARDDASGVAECDLQLGALLERTGPSFRAVEHYELARAFYRSRRDRRAVSMIDVSVRRTVWFDKGGRLRLWRAERYFAALGLLAEQAECDRVRALRATWPSRRSRFAARASESFRHAGLPLEAARCDILWALSEAPLLLGEALPPGHWAERRAREALEVAVPAALFIDSYRFQLATRGERAAWADNVAHEAFTAALRIAQLVGGSVAAQLILDARTAGTYSVVSDGTAASGGALVDEAIPSTAGPAWTASSALGRLIGADGYRLEPTPHIRSWDGSVVLEHHLRAARQRYGGAALRRPVIVEQA